MSSMFPPAPSSIHLSPPPPYRYTPPPYWYTPPPYRYTPPPYRYTPPPYRYTPPPYWYTPPPYRYTPPSSPSGFTAGGVVGFVIGVIAVPGLLIWMCIRFRMKLTDKEASLGPQVNQQQNASKLLSNRAMPSLPQPKPPSDQQNPSHSSHVMSSSSNSGSYSNYSDQINLPPLSPGLGVHQNTFTYEDLSRATNGFSEANLLGQGGFGYVFKGVLRDGKDIAVKQLRAGSAQGEREFRAEVEIISRVHHRNLVTLVGFCISKAQRLLVYEFVPNNTLHFHLHGKGQPPLQWSSRMKIAVGSAKALTYLHENCHPKIIHRDIKAANILIDFKFEAKVADFGLAKLVSDANTHVSTRIMGTFGYLAPEYAASGKLTEKSDVYSFGVILLELITGHLPFNSIQDDNLVDWALPLLNQASEKGDFEGLADAKMNNEYDREEMARMVACAAACVRHRARHRPTMDQVVRVLCGNVLPSELKEGIKPVKTSWTDYDTSENNEDIKNIRKVALGNLNYNTSSEYSKTTSDFGMQSSGSSTRGGQTTREMESDIYL